MDRIIQKALNEATKSYEKILEITGEIENNLKVLGLDYNLHFIIEEREITFAFSRNDIVITEISISYVAYKKLSKGDIVYLTMRALMNELLDWRGLINTLQE